MLTFDEERHEYRYNGAVVPHVTGVIAPLSDWSRVPPDVLQRAQDLGRVIHAMVELDSKDDLDTETLPEWMRGHYEALCRCKAETGLQVLASEERVYHAELGYAGTLDLRCVMPKLKRLRGTPGPAIIDVKRTAYDDPSTGVQTAAYAAACPKDEYERYGLKLNVNGTYRLHRFTDRNDYAVFVACLTVYRYMEKHK